MVMAFRAMATVDPHLNAQTPVCPPTSGAGNPSVLTGQYDNYRDAHNASETCLYSTAIYGGTVTIAEASFSPLLLDTPPAGSGLNGGSAVLTNPIYAQPLYIRDRIRPDVQHFEFVGKLQLHLNCSVPRRAGVPRRELKRGAGRGARRGVLQ
jgi:hypothetical protein